jgi:hypothetical protein
VRYTAAAVVGCAVEVQAIIAQRAGPINVEVVLAALFTLFSITLNTIIGTFFTGRGTVVKVISNDAGYTIHWIVVLRAGVTKGDAAATGETRMYEVVGDIAFKTMLRVGADKAIGPAFLARQGCLVEVVAIFAIPTSLSVWRTGKTIGCLAVSAAAARKVVVLSWRTADSIVHGYSVAVTRQAVADRHACCTACSAVLTRVAACVVVIPCFATRSIVCRI